MSTASNITPSATSNAATSTPRSTTPSTASGTAPAVFEPLIPAGLDLTGFRLGRPQSAGALTMVPVTGPAHEGFVPPRSGLKLSRVVGYGNVELTNGASSGIAIVPLHIGYIQNDAQNHALCRSAFIAAGQTLRFEDACCVQESQGGYLKDGGNQWFFVLPSGLRARALELRGTTGYSKLWSDIAALNQGYSLPQRGHLEQILTRKRAVLTQFQSRLELQPGQLGALFFLDGPDGATRWAGLEIAPDPLYFAEMWMALVCFAYGVAAWAAEPQEQRADPYDAVSLRGLRDAFELDRRRDRVGELVSLVPSGDVVVQEEERLLGLRLSTVDGEDVAGQYVSGDGERLVYASVFAKN